MEECTDETSGSGSQKEMFWRPTIQLSLKLGRRTEGYGWLNLLDSYDPAPMGVGRRADAVYRRRATRQPGLKAATRCCTPSPRMSGRRPHRKGEGNCPSPSKRESKPPAIPSWMITRSVFGEALVTSPADRRFDFLTRRGRLRQKSQIQVGAYQRESPGHLPPTASGRRNGPTTRGAYARAVPGRALNHSFVLAVFVLRDRST